jgi:hypothetical protein
MPASILKSIAAVTLVAFAAASQAQTQTPQAAKLTALTTGWNDDVFGIAVDAPMVNPAGCSTADKYVSSALNPGHKTHYAAVLLAYSTGRRVTVVVHNSVCTHDRPTIMGLVVAPA